MARRLFRDLACDDSGSIFLQFTVLLAVMMGLAGLSIDMGRLVTTNTQAKSAADAAALAAATALAAAVRAPGADPDNPQPVIDAVHQAAQTGVQNAHNFATVVNGGQNATGGTVQITQIRLLTSLPELQGGGETDPVTPYVTGDPWQARFVEVTTEALSHNNTFMPVVGGAQTSTTAATAIAGYFQVTCQIPPLWICNPAESAGAGSPLIPDEWRGRQLRLRSAAPGSAWSPGNFGLLDAPFGQGVPAVTQNMATVAPEACFQSTGVDLRPGQANPVVHGLNTRFDMYDSPHTPRNDAAYRPALNVAKGFVYNTPACNANQTTAEAQAQMPRDANLIANPLERLGDGNWDCLSYWNANHAGVAAPAGCTTPSQMARYDLYREEIALGVVTANGTPQCYTGATPIPAEPDRRIIYFAVVNCTQGGLNGNRDDVPAAAFAKAFLTEPVADPPNDEIFLEFLDVVRPGDDDGVLHEIVQLYR